MAETIDRRGQISFETDVLVVGGGAAGVAAAFTAARAGARVLLLENMDFAVERRLRAFPERSADYMQPPKAPRSLRNKWCSVSPSASSK
jgi:flavin-dependent dehydrogenase